MKFKRIIAYFVLAIVLFATGCSTSKKEEELVDLSCIAGQDLTNSSVVRWIGRTEYSATEERVYTYFAATGFVVKFVGTEL